MLNDAKHIFDRLDLKNLTIDIPGAGMPCTGIHSEHVFLSKLTGFLAFRMMLWKGAIA